MTKLIRDQPPRNRLPREFHPYARQQEVRVRTGRFV
jgi:hypothetical protein